MDGHGRRALVLSSVEESGMTLMLVPNRLSGKTQAAVDAMQGRDVLVCCVTREQEEFWKLKGFRTWRPREETPGYFQGFIA